MQNQLLPAETATATAPYVTPSVTVETGDTTETRASTQAVTDMLAKVRRKIRRRNVKYWAAFAVLQTMSIFAFPGITFYRSYLNLPAMPIPPVVFFLPILFVAGMMFLLRYMPSYFDSEALARLGGSKAIPTLLDSLTANASPVHRKTTLRALTLLLPQLQATDANLLTPGHRNLLNMLLKAYTAPSLWTEPDQGIVLAILKAYEQVGDTQAIPVVEGLANGRRRNERQRSIQEAAANCLPLLRARAGDVDTTRTLLRASAFDTNTPNSLLRAATAQPEAHQAELLRAANANDAPPTP